jgi:hypothetical protein
MKVSELIERLQTYRQDALVVVRGYENGYDDIINVKEVMIKPAANPQWYDGIYEEVRVETSEMVEKAILLFGKDRSGEE